MCPECGSNPKAFLVLLILSLVGVIRLIHQNARITAHQKNQIANLQAELKTAKFSRGEPFPSDDLPDGPHFPRGNIIMAKITNPKTGDKEYKFFWKPGIIETRMIWDSHMDGNPRITRYIKDNQVAEYSADKFDKLDKKALTMTREHGIATMADEGVIFKHGNKAILYQRDTGQG